MAWLLAHSQLILMVALTLSEVLGALGVGGIIPGVVSALKALGAKDVDGK